MLLKAPQQAMVAFILGIGLLGGVLLCPGVPMCSFLEPENPAIEKTASHPAPVRIPDLGLWRRNPAEADLKYKDQFVEIEMNLHLLEVTPGKACLSTDRRHLSIPSTQPVEFGFEGRNRSRLLGLGLKHGNIVIRGKCSGMNKDEIVVFRNCEIVRLTPTRESE